MILNKFDELVSAWKIPVKVMMSLPHPIGVHWRSTKPMSFDVMTGYAKLAGATEAIPWSSQAQHVHTYLYLPGLLMSALGDFVDPSHEVIWGASTVFKSPSCPEVGRPYSNYNTDTVLIYTLKSNPPFKPTLSWPYHTSQTKPRP